MNNLILILMISTFVASCGRDKSTSKDVDIAPSYIIGGSSEVNYPLTTTVSLNNGQCSGVKVGDTKVMTAAHCVFAKGLDVYLNYFPGYTNIVKNYLGESVSYIVKKTYIHKTYDDEVENLVSRNLQNDEALKNAYDIVILEFREEIKNVNIAQINFETTSPSTTGLITGAGRELGKSNNFVKSQKIKSAQVEFIQIEDISKDFLEEYNATNIANYYHLTLGSMSSNNKSGLAPGDSGGGLFLENNLIGINSFSGHLIPLQTYFHAHTRLSDLKTWIEDIL